VSYEVKRPLHGTSLAGLEPSGTKEADQPQPDRLTKAQKKAIAIAVRRGGASKEASFATAEIPASTGHMWIREDPEFALAMEQADAGVEVDLIGALIAYGLSGKPNSHIALAIALERKWPGRYGRRDRIEHNVHVDVGHDVRAVLASPEAIQAASALEAALQNAEARSLPSHSDAIDGEVLSERGPDLP
jgi:hypothetical protein